MSLRLHTHVNRFKTKGALVLGISGMLLTASMLAPVSGAYFSDSRDGHATASTSRFGLSVEDGNQAFNFGFEDLVPGSEHAESFTVKNTGTIAGSLSFYASGLTVSGATNPDMSQLHLKINQEDVTPRNGQLVWTDLGELAAGQERTYTLTASLDDNAGNAWSDITVRSDVGMTLRQAF